VKRRGGGWLLAPLVLVAIIAGGMYWMRSHPRRMPDPITDRLAAGLSTAALAESVDAAHARHDWLSAVRWGRPLVDRMPRNADALCDLALAIHNVSLVGTLRNSLQRMRYDNLAIALMDSSRVCASNLADWIRAERYLGNFYEILGLPLEALERYEAILARAPRDSVGLARRYWVAAHLMDPRSTDFPRFKSGDDPLPDRVRHSHGR